MLFATQNCWFCNKNSDVLFAHKNSWTCKHCKQYNGFTEEGDYNKEIKEMHDVNNNRTKFTSKKRYGPFSGSSNGLCDHCNYYQQLKIDKLAEFKPRHEEDYDTEIKSYKEYLEKIYELCVQCKSKVNFEITKQNGILKEYFLNLGNFDYFYETRKKAQNTKENKLVPNLNVKPIININQKLTLYSAIVQLIQFISFLAIFVCSALIFLYNHHRMNDTNFLQDYHLLAHLKQIIFNFLCIFFNFDSSESVYNYLNMNLPYFLIAIYVICCFLVLEHKKKRNSFIFLSTSFIWLIDLILIIINYKKFLPIVNKSTLVGPTNRIDLGSSVYYLMPLIQLIILAIVVYVLFSLINNSFQREMPKSRLFNELRQHIKVNLNQTVPNLENYNNNEDKRTIQFNYDLISPETYTLMKYIQQKQMKQNSKLKLNETAFSNSSEFIRPARFNPSETTFKSKTKNARKNSLDASDRLSNNSDSENSDESSIISGLTNLYLQRTNPKTDLSLFETNYKKITKSNISKLNKSLCESSFYQEIPSNRTLISSNLNKKNSTSLSNIFKD